MRSAGDSFSRLGIGAISAGAGVLAIWGLVGPSLESDGSNRLGKLSTLADSSGVSMAASGAVRSTGYEEEGRPTRPLVLFDTGHAQRFFPDREGALDLSNLAGLFEEEGAQVGRLATPLTVEALSTARALVLSGPFRPLSSTENGAVLEFLGHGGALAVMLHIGSPVAELLHSLNVSISNGVIRETQDLIDADPRNFRVERLAPHLLTAGVGRFLVYGAWALIPTADGVNVLAETGPHAWIDLDGDNQAGPRDAIQGFAVMVTGSYGSGRFVVFGDDTLFQNQFLLRGNRKLAKALSTWLVHGQGAGPRSASLAPELADLLQ